MTENEWLNATDPRLMLEFLRGKVSERKLRLLGCGCLRRVSHLLTDKRGLRAVEATEKYVDGLLNRQALQGASGDANLAVHYAAELAIPALRAASILTEVIGIDLPDRYLEKAQDVLKYARYAAGDDASEKMAQVSLLREVFGNPFRPVILDAAWLTPIVTALAQAAYKERSLPAGTLDTDRLAILADALEDAGCTDASLLEHLRGPGPHYRGCWPVDLILAKM
jgi:hypothetical protein